MSWIDRILAAVLLLTICPTSQVLAQKNFGFDNTKPSGQPYWKAEESARRFQTMPGWQVEVFAAEPDVINPIAFTIDERGRIWVVENFEYPNRTPRGRKPRDRIKILEDTDGDGKCDKVTIWADGQHLPIGWELGSGIEVGHGGIFFGAAPYLFFLQDTDGDGKCDRQEILLKGFGSQDTHETLNTFTWGPDSKLYGLHGVFTHSEVNGIRMNAAVWRYDPRDRKFAIFAEGTSNPWGMDFDAHGQCFIAACVIPHLYHIVPGGTYIRQAGGSFNPYAYGLMPEISDHLHHRESGWAHAGVIVLDGSHVPEPLRGSIIMGSIHGCSIKRDVLRPNGSTFIAGHAPDFLVSGDKNFRPINMRWGPDGSIYVIDWHDQNPCHQARPDSWDKTHGRIYRLRPRNSSQGRARDLGKVSSKELVGLLTNDNPYWYRTALRLLSERRDKSVAPVLRDMAFTAGFDHHALRGLWGLYAVGALESKDIARGLKHTSPWFRSWVIRLAGESGPVPPGHFEQWTALAATDPTPQVRLQLAATARRLTGQDVLPLLHNLIKHKEDAGDKFLPLMIWLAYEARVPGQRDQVLSWLRQHAAGNALASNEIVPRVMRRLAATNRPEDLAACLDFLAEVGDSTIRRQALAGLLEAYRGRQLAPPAAWKKAFARALLDRDERVRELARRLAVHFQDPEAIARALALVRDAHKKTPERIAAIRDVALALPPDGIKILTDLVHGKEAMELRVEACRALAGYDRVEIAGSLVAGWKSLPPPVRAEAVNLLSSRKPWARQLLMAVGKKVVARTDLTDNTILRIRAFGDKKLIAQVEAVWGRFRDTPAELNALIEKMRAQLFAGTGSMSRGRKVFENQCAKCHKFEGKGHEVGPNLDGAARDIEYLLANVLDPNRVVGQPYYIRTVELKNGRIETGLLIAEDAQSITLKGENDVVKVIPRNEIEGKVLIQEKSIMPEGLANNMSVQDFRDLIRYVMANPFLTGVSISGPFPETEAKTKKSEWTKPIVGPPGRIPLPAVKKGESGTTFIQAEVTAPAAMHTRLLLGASQHVHVLLNGRLVYSGIPGAEPVRPDQAGVEVDLRQGLNVVLLQVTYQGDNEAVYARFLDPDRKLRYPE